VTGALGKPVLRARDFCQASMTPDGRAVYIACLHQGTVTPISTATNTAGKAIRLKDPLGMEFTPSGRTGFVIGLGTVTPVSIATNTPGRTFNIGRHTSAQTFAPDGRTVYAINDAGTPLTPYSARTGRAGRSIPVPAMRGTGYLVITPDGRTIYVTSIGSSHVTPVSVAGHKAGKPLQVTGSPVNIAITPDGKVVYASSAMAGREQAVTPISTATNTVGKTIRIATQRIEILIPGDQSL
jgi:DNA-binding beta-propeller fold protein YncE